MATEVDYEKDFCAEMRDKTRKFHNDSDKLINLKLVAALTDTTTWGQAVSEFYFVFRQLEISLGKLKGDPRLGIFHFCAKPEYGRTEPFREDLKYHLGDDWANIIKPSEVAIKYCGRLEEIRETKPILLIAYIHSMYMALLAGGATIQLIVKKTLGLSGSEGLALFNFGSESNRAESRGRMQAAINSVTLTREEKDEIIKEKIRCFKMNNAIANNLPTSFSNYRRFFLLTSGVVVLVALIAGLVMLTFRE